ncbi:MAG: nucleoid occlusion protein [Clostridium sp.]|uniref:nucleoid occlusion protein n=1 Tax=Clostridium sp. TaxID=1506 RepID=UPI002FC63FC0
MKAEREVINIPIIQVRQNTYQPRKFFNEESLLELSESIREYGVLQPITVRRMGDRFELIAGERRLRASQLAGLNEVPAIVVNLTDTESAVLALIENLQREDLSYMEEAEGYYNLIREHDFTQEELASKIGKKQSTIANKLRLLKLSNTVKEALLENELTERHARALLKLPTEEMQLEAIDLIVKRGLNVKKTEMLIESMLEEKNSKSEEKFKQKWTFNPRIITNTLKQIMEKSGIEAEYKHREKEDCVEIIVKIPKK